MGVIPPVAVPEFGGELVELLALLHVELDSNGSVLDGPLRRRDAGNLDALELDDDGVLLGRVVVIADSDDLLRRLDDDWPVSAFLRELLRHCEAADAMTHIHLDPTAVDERMVEGVQGQVDAVLSLEEG